jgi:hypothetical protein
MRAKTITKHHIDSPFNQDIFMGDRAALDVNVPEIVDPVLEMINSGLMYRFPDPLDSVEELEDCIQVTAYWPSRAGAEAWHSLTADRPYLISREIIDIED